MKRWLVDRHGTAVRSSEVVCVRPATPGWCSVTIRTGEVVHLELDLLAEPELRIATTDWIPVAVVVVLAAMVGVGAGAVFF